MKSSSLITPAKKTPVSTSSTFSSTYPSTNPENSHFKTDIKPSKDSILKSATTIGSSSSHTPTPTPSSNPGPGPYPSPVSGPYPSPVPGPYPSPVPGPVPSPLDMSISTEKVNTKSAINHDNSNDDGGNKSNDNIDKFYSNNDDNDYKNTINKLIKTPKKLNNLTSNSEIISGEDIGINSNIKGVLKMRSNDSNNADNDDTNNASNKHMETENKQYIQINKNKYVTSQELQEAVDNMNYSIHKEVQTLMREQVSLGYTHIY
jgi:hypothetical protein